MSQTSETKVPAVDMSAEAIAARIAEVAALNRLCESLGQARPVVAAAAQSAPSERADTTRK